MVKHSKYSAVIIGSGIAGLYAAIKLSSQMNLPDDILIITKSNLAESNTRYAQGGIVAVLPENELDSVSLHISDTIKAGCGLSDFNVTKFISENSSTVINDLLSYGVNFDKDEKNNFSLTLEGAHSVKRVLHSGGDATGFFMEKALVERVLADDNITILEQSLAVELLVDSDSHCKGLIAYNSATHEYETIYSSVIILATGGLGQIFKYTTNPPVATGDGIALAYRAGAILQDMEFIQFHPTALVLEDADELSNINGQQNHPQNRFLISEALRGEGASLVDEKAEKFMEKYDERQELAPRDIVTRAIFEEMKKSNAKKVYLDAKHIPKTRFPNINKVLEDNNIDINKDLIPVAPAAHYTMGGIKTNIEGKTSLKGLYAIGEAACTGLHGANRLASNSLLECVVCAYELANYLSFVNFEASDSIDDCILETIKKYKNDNSDVNYVEYDESQIEAFKNRLQEIMWENVGIVRDEESLLRAQSELNKIKIEFAHDTKCNSKSQYELRNMLIAAKLVIKGALLRKESLGAHYRSDYTVRTENIPEKAVSNTISNKKEGRYGEIFTP